MTNINTTHSTMIQGNNWYVSISNVRKWCNSAWIYGFKDEFSLDSIQYVCNIQWLVCPPVPLSTALPLQAIQSKGLIKVGVKCRSTRVSRIPHRCTIALRSGDVLDRMNLIPDSDSEPPLTSFSLKHAAVSLDECLKSCWNGVWQMSSEGDIVSQNNNS